VVVLLNVACEGSTDEAVLRRVLDDLGLQVNSAYVLRGKANLDAKLPGMKAAARSSRWLVLRDLNGDAPCAPALVAELAGNAPSTFRLHVAVRKLEAWLLADAEGIGALLGVLPRLVPSSPDRLEDPRHELLALARRSKKGRVHRDFLPNQTSARVGPAYSARIIEFALTMWSPDRARVRSQSLGSLVDYLGDLVKS
jgi:hypothetical protein